MSDPKIDIDPDTGLPALKDGYFWRVERGTGYFSDLLYISIEKRTPRWYNKNRTETVESTVREWEGFQAASDKPAFIFEAAIGMRRRRLSDDAATDLLGDYPPKRLEV